MKLEIKSRFSAKVLFSFERGNNSIKLTLESALKSDANLYGAYLRDANLCGANLCGANLCGADLCGADLCGSDLRGADLYGSDLRDANLCGANLCGANLCGADLCGADLRGADLYGANLRRADGSEFKCDGKYYHLHNIGSENGVLELYSCGSDSWLVKRGCFIGSKDEFLAAVEKKHSDNNYGKKYRAIIAALCD